MCKDIQVNGVLEVKPYIYPPWVAKPNVVIYKDKEYARAIIKDYKLGQVNIYINTSVYNGRARIGVYATLSKVMLLKTVASFNQADAYLTKLLVINEAANWPWDPMYMAID